MNLKKQTLLSVQIKEPEGVYSKLSKTISKIKMISRVTKQAFKESFPKENKNAI